jgi:hypothetical protein
MPGAVDFDGNYEPEPAEMVNGDTLMEIPWS